ncbi:MAG TPA: CHC2 zinc finger domain-containing protein [bacterium]|nr:CHC2 zinc finger domain-containing protein [bacterium]
MPKNDEWKNKLDYALYWSQRTDGQARGDEWTAHCPFHEDRSPSFSAKLEAPGLWTCHAHCEGSGGGGSIVHFHSRLYRMSPHDAEEELRVLAGERRTVPAEEVADRHRNLLGTTAVVDWLRLNKGITVETIRRFELGFDGERIWIPVKFRGHYVNVRKYDWTRSDAKSKYIPYASGMNTARLFPWDNLRAEGPLYLFEGEFKAILANQLGIPGISPTGGAGTWPNHFTEHARGRDVVICYDIDKEGREGAHMVAHAVMPVARSVKVVQLPITEPRNGDFNDWILRGNGMDDFLDLVSRTLVFLAPKEDTWKPDIQEYRTTLSQSSNSRYQFRSVDIPVTVSGKDLTPYEAPRKVTLKCGVDQGKKCSACGLRDGGLLTLDIPKTSRDILKLIDCSDDDQRRVFSATARLVPCIAWTSRIEDFWPVEEIRVIPEVTFSDDDNQYVSRTIYSVTEEPLKANRSYGMKGVSLPHPYTQYATVIVHEAIPSQASYEKFQMDADKAAGMAVLRPAAAEGAEGRLRALTEKLGALATDLSLNVTKVTRREDILMATLLTYASVRQFSFGDEPVRKGWVEACIAGDTRTAKSKTVEAVLRWLHLGEFATGENTSFAGLVGGLSQVGSRWHLTWGKIPLNNGGLLVIDEAQGLSVEAIAAMSGVRSSGIAEVVKIQHERTEAQTRFIWIANPRSGRHLGTYNYGVQAVRELMGNVEDVARLDLAVTAASGEVDTTLINTLDKPKADHVHTAEVMRNAILWAWSRRPNQVRFTDGAIRQVFDAANAMSRVYSSAIPLVEGGEMRIKLAKLAVSAAVLSFSSEDDMTVLVREEHVLWVVGFLDLIYSKPSMGYRQFSEVQNRSRSMPEEAKQRVIAEFLAFPRPGTLKETFLSVDIFQKKAFLDLVGYDTDLGKDLWTWLNRRRLILTKSSGFVKTPIFTEILRRIPDGQEGGDKPDAATDTASLPAF